MNGWMKKCGLLTAVLCLFLTGCGEELWTMTPEEEELIVAYTSGAVAKSNKYQAQGLTYYEEEEEVEPEPGSQEPSAEETDPPAEEERGQENGTDPADQPPSEETEESPQPQAVTLTEALGLSPVTAEYRGYQITDNYVEGSYFALRAEAGNQYIILNIALSNPAQEAVECNNLVRSIRCTLVVNGQSRAEAEPTILLNDLATYIDTLSPGAVQDTILIFEVPGDVAANVQSLAMEIQVEDMAYHVNLQ